MHRLAILLFLLLFGLYAHWQIQYPPPPPLEEGYTALFDGKSLAGWHKIGGESSFAVKRGQITGSHGPGENTFLRTQNLYADFILKMDFRWDELGNSGVLFRAGQRDGDSRAYGYQFELDHSDRDWSGGIYDEARRGWLATLAENDAARAAIRKDDWNEITIEARGTSIKTFLNGVAAADIIDGFDAQGFIALQVHAGGIGEMRWRNIRIMELDAQTQPGVGLTDAGDWKTRNIDDWNLEDGRLSGVFQEQAARLASKRLLGDVFIDMTVPVCEVPTRVRVRRESGASGGGASYAELVVDSTSAQLTLVQADSQSAGEVLTLEAADTRRLRFLAVADRLTVSVDDSDVARMSGTGLPWRGQLVIEPGRCQQQFAIEDFAWQDLRVRSKEKKFYQTLDNQPAQPFTPQQAQADFRLAPGFDIELVAAEPLVEDPVAMSWDEYGRLYVVEMRGFMPDAYGTGRDEPVGQVVRLTDTDGDGRMDTSEVFLDQLINPRAVAVVNEGILVGEPPQLWLCELPVKDALCSTPRKLGEYGIVDDGASVEHIENGLLPGLDNWYYNSKSSRALRIKDGELHVRESLFRGQWGIARDNQGRLLYNNNSNFVSADFFAAEDLFDEATYNGSAGLGEVLSAPEEVFSVRVNPGVNRAYLDGTLRPDGRLHKATAVSGLVSYRGDQFPREYLGRVFVPEPGANVVAEFAITGDDIALAAEHLTYADEKWGQREFLAATDERFRPVDAMNGPDGALYIIDMYRGIVQDEHFITEELRDQVLLRGLDTPIGGGRIWRLRHRDGKQDRAFPDLANASASQRVAALGHDNGWVRDTAQRLLLAQVGAGRDDLAGLLVGDNSLAAIHALWTLHGRDELEREALVQMLAVEDRERQLHTLRAGRGVLTAQDLLAFMTASDALPASVRMQLAFALGDFAAQDAVQQALLALLGVDIQDSYVQAAAVRAVSGIELVFLPKLLPQGRLPQGRLQEESDGGRELLATITAATYRNLRGPLDSRDPAPESLLELLALVAQQTAEREWMQVAMLEGLSKVARTSGFAPAVLMEPPPLFSDGSIDEDSPLWAARLEGRRAFTWPGDELAAGITPLSPRQLAAMEKGAGIYARCATCHGIEGTGIAGLAPALADSQWVNGPPEWLGRIILQGFDSDRDGIMPPHAHMPELDDEGLAGLMIYLRRSWGHTANPVDVEMVTSLRAASVDRSLPWTAVELEAVPVDKGYGRFVGEYQVSFLTFTIYEEQGKLLLEVPMYGGGELVAESDTVFTSAAGGESVRIEFTIEEDGSVQEFILHREGQKIMAERK